MLTCRDMVHLVEEARDGTLSPIGRARLVLHRAVCGGCRAYMRGMDATVAALHDAQDEPAPDATKAAVLARLREKRG